MKTALKQKGSRIPSIQLSRFSWFEKDSKINSDPKIIFIKDSLTKVKFFKLSL